jgi:MFS transporter, DHA1 family, multidrug resistance protein
MRIHPESFTFTILLGLLSSVPTFGIDMVLPTLPAISGELGVPLTEVGLAMTAYLIGLGATLLVYGPISDRFGRKPIIVFGCALLIIASFGCIFAHSLPQLLIFRSLQGAGASGPGMGAVTIVRDLFDGAAARAKMVYLVFAVNIVPMIAPTVGATFLLLGGWQAIYLVPIAVGCVLLLAILGLEETARIDPAARFTMVAVVRDYLSVLRHPICLGNVLCNAAAAGAVFAYISGSSFFFINLLGLSPSQYGLIFGVSSLAVISGTHLNQRLSNRGASPGQLITIGLALSTVLAALLLVMALAAGKSILLVVLVMVGVALSFGLISPNAMTGALQPMPAIAGSVSAVVVFVQMLAAASSSGLVAAFFDGRSALSMAIVMIVFCLLATVSYLSVARATKTPRHSHTIAAKAEWSQR